MRCGLRFGFSSLRVCTCSRDAEEGDLALEVIADVSPILGRKAYDEASVFQVENLLREGRRQRSRTDERVPAVCILDPDGDVVRHLRSANNARLHDGWACYHSELWVTSVEGKEIGVVPCAVGAPYAVLIAEQLAHQDAHLSSPSPRPDVSSHSASPRIS